MYSICIYLCIGAEKISNVLHVGNMGTLLENVRTAGSYSFIICPKYLLLPKAMLVVLLLVCVPSPAAGRNVKSYPIANDSSIVVLFHLLSFASSFS